MADTRVEDEGEVEHTTFAAHDDSGNAVGYMVLRWVVTPAMRRVGTHEIRGVVVARCDYRGPGAAVADPDEALRRMTQVEHARSRAERGKG